MANVRTLFNIYFIDVLAPINADVVKIVKRAGRGGVGAKMVGQRVS